MQTVNLSGKYMYFDRNMRFTCNWRIFVGKLQTLTGTSSNKTCGWPTHFGQGLRFWKVFETNGPNDYSLLFETFGKIKFVP
jgi:hypothetical protein